MEEDIEANLLAVIEAALDESEDLAEHAMKRLDNLSRDEKEARANVSARPRYEVMKLSTAISVNSPHSKQINGNFMKCSSTKAPPMGALPNNCFS